jgi:hypothetical protein
VSYDWSIVGYGSHPIPGDPDTVLSSASAFRSTGEHITSAARSLEQLEAGDNRSEALSKILTNAHEVAGSLLQAVDRYYEASEALRTYGPIMAKAKAQAEAALQAAATARSQQQHAASNAHNLYEGARASQDPLQRDEFLAAYHHARAQAEDAAGSLAAAKARIEEAIQMRNAAGDHAASRLHVAISGKDINDTILDKVSDVWDDLVELGKDLYENFPAIKALVDTIAAIGKWIWDNIETIAVVLTVLSFLLGWVPFLGQALFVLARVANLIALVKSAVNMGGQFAKGVRTGDFSEFFIAAGMFVAFWGAGKLIGRAFGDLAKKPLTSLKMSTSHRFGTGVTNQIVADVKKPSTLRQVGAFLDLVEQPGSEMAQIDALIDNMRLTRPYYANFDVMALKLGEELAKEAVEVGGEMINIQLHQLVYLTEQGAVR